MNFKQIISLNLVLALLIPNAFAQTMQGGGSYGGYTPGTRSPLNSWRTNNTGSSLNLPSPVTNGFAIRPMGVNGLNVGSSAFGAGSTTFGRRPPLCYTLDCFKDSPWANTSLDLRNTGLKNGLLQTIDDISCGLEIGETNLDSAKEATDIASCYSKRNEIDSSVTRTEFDKFQEDIAICGCLRIKGLTVPSVQEIMNTEINSLKNISKRGDGNRSISEGERMAFFERNAMAIRGQMDRNSFGMTFQASVLAKMTDKSADGNGNLAAIYATDPLGRNIRPIDFEGGRRDPQRHSTGRESNISLLDSDESTQSSGSSGNSGNAGRSGVINGATGAVASFVERSTGDQDEFINGILPSHKKRGGGSSNDTLLRYQVAETLNRMNKPNPAPAELFDPVDVKKPTQCVSAREFMAYKQIPDADAVREIQNSNNPDDWNYTTLKKEYDDLMARPYADREGQRTRIASLKSRLFYLERNPMLKNFLKADDSNLDKFFLMMPTDDEAKIRKSYQADPPRVADSRERKAQLLGILKKAIGNSEEAMTAQQDVLKFFANPANALVTIAENNKTNLNLVNDFLGKRKGLFSSKAEVMSRAEVDRSFATFNLGSPKDCDEESNVEFCVRTYAGYCQYLDQNKSKITNLRFENDPVLVDDYESKVSSFFDPNPETNPELKEFIDSACNTPRRTSAADQEGNYQTFWQYFDSQCRSKGMNCANPSPEEIQNMRAEYLSKNPEPAIPNRGVATREIIAFNELMKKVKVSRGSTQAERDAIAQAATKPVDVSSALADMNRSWGFEDNMFETAPQRPAEVSFATAGTGVGAATTKIDNRIDNSSVIDDPMTPSYSMFNGAAALGNTPVQAGDQPQKVENMTEPQRQELLDDWQKEYDTWKKSRTAESSQAASATEAAMKARIEALEQLLAQQKKLTDDQYKLLNDAIANQTRSTGATSVAQTQSEGSSSQSNVRNRSLASVAASESEEQASRTPASVPEQNFNTSGSGAGAGGASVGASGGAGSARRAGATSGDDVAREEAKLVSMRSSSDGSIVISNVNPSAGAVANAVSVPVSDEQYRALQANPQSLNLAQIEQSIPRDQIAKLEKEGEIIILLRNGSNPPFEVKVARKNNKLVYSLKDKNGRDQAPIRRVYTRQALELQLKATR